MDAAVRGVRSESRDRRKAVYLQFLGVYAVYLRGGNCGNLGQLRKLGLMNRRNGGNCPGRSFPEKLTSVAGAQRARVKRAATKNPSWKVRPEGC